MKKLFKGAGAGTVCRILDYQKHFSMMLSAFMLRDSPSQFLFRKNIAHLHRVVRITKKHQAIDEKGQRIMTGLS